MLKRDLEQIVKVTKKYVEAKLAYDTHQHDPNLGCSGEEAKTEQKAFKQLLKCLKRKL